MADPIDFTTSSQVGPLPGFSETTHERSVADYSAQLFSSIQDAPSVEGVQNPTLSDLQKLVNSAMIPLLTEVFETAQELKNPHTRLSSSSALSEEEARKRLSCMEKDLETIALWAQTCLKQVKKAQCLTEDPPASGREKGISWLKRAFLG